MSSPKVLIGSPVTSLKEYSIPQYIEGLKSLTYKNKELLVLDNSPDGRDLSKPFADAGIPYMKTPHTNSVREMLVRDHNFLRKKAIDEGFDYWLSLEQDIIPPPNVVESLLANKKEIASGVYFNFSHEKEDGNPKPDMFVTIDPLDKKFFVTRRMLFDDLWPSRLINVHVTGVGCLLIHKTVLQKLEFHFDPAISVYDDVWFCKDAQKNGFEVFLDSKVVCLHLAKFHSKELIDKLGFS
ncbi:MAG: hypothetical protein AABW85_03210 [archaeon]